MIWDGVGVGCAVLPTSGTRTAGLKTLCNVGSKADTFQLGDTAQVLATVSSWLGHQSCVLFQLGDVVRAHCSR